MDPDPLIAKQVYFPVLSFVKSVMVKKDLMFEEVTSALFGNVRPLKVQAKLTISLLSAVHSSVTRLPFKTKP